MSFVISGKKQDFEPCPEFTGRAVCVDVTPLKKVDTEYGQKEKFRLVFEVDEGREDGSRWCVWSSGFTPSLHKKAAFRQFVEKWLGRALTEAEFESFDVENLVGRPAFIVVVHAQKEDQVYANIASCTPHKSGSPLKPSGEFKRSQDRENGGGGGKDSSYRRTETPKGKSSSSDDEDDPARLKIHVGRHKGCELRELNKEAVIALIDHWLPGARKAAKPTADDRRLIKALEWFEEQEAQTAAEPDDVPY